MSQAAEVLSVNSSTKKETVLLLQMVVTAICDRPEEVKVDFLQGEQTTVFQIKVATSDIGKVIGKQGQMAAALRMIVKGISGKYNFRAVLEILE